MSSVRAELSKCVSQCFTQTNDAVRNRLSELMKSKVWYKPHYYYNVRVFFLFCSFFQDMSDAIGKAVAVHLQGALPAVLENIFKAVILEPVERAFQGMFKQIDETFRKGTMECE